MKNLIIILVCILTKSASPQVKNKKTSNTEQSELTPINFDSIRDVINKDRLGSEVVKKEKSIIKRKNKIKRKKIEKYNIPDDENFWSFFSEFWLVKNAMVLKWDFKKPDYGLEKSFRNFLEALGIFELRYKVLLVNTPDITHFALPSDSGEMIFLLSAPFLRTLDLSKLEISILLFEDYLRVKNHFFKNYVKVKGIDNFIGGNFHKKTFNKQLLDSVARRYDEIIYDKGFNFQQQFKITGQMDKVLKSNPKWWNTYFRLITKIDNLVKTNILYQKYLKIYPSPELQLGWLKPKKKRVL